jgi:hypothetical protein
MRPAGTGEPLGSLPLWTPRELDNQRREMRDLFILDVRQPGEWRAGHVPDAHHISGRELPGQREDVSRDKPVAVYCGSGYRSSVGPVCCGTAAIATSTTLSVVFRPGRQNIFQSRTAKHNKAANTFDRNQRGNPGNYLDVPLIRTSQPVPLPSLQRQIATLGGPDRDKTLARQQHLPSPMSCNLLMCIVWSDYAKGSLDRWTAARDKKDHGKNQSDNKQYPRDVGCRPGNAGKSEYACDDRNNQKSQCPAQHVSLLAACTAGVHRKTIVTSIKLSIEHILKLLFGFITRNTIALLQGSY